MIVLTLISIVAAFLASVLFGLFVESLTFAQLRSALIALGTAGIWLCASVISYYLPNWWPFKRARAATPAAKLLTSCESLPYVGAGFDQLSGASDGTSYTSANYETNPNDPNRTQRPSASGRRPRTVH